LDSTCCETIDIYIINNSNITVPIDMQDSQIFLIQEAYNAKNNWKPIEYWMYSDCGMSYHSVYLPPNYCIKSKIIKYFGTVETNLRIKLKMSNYIYYSNIFRGKMNLDQFSSPGFIQEINLDWFLD